ncbi:MAG TPA: hypothetical protein VG755_35385 [Nannocystaceae bacterium]|nr:hypothetical protein [Nannocystaceae bacterium]
MQHHDLSLLFSLGLVGCSLDVGDALTDTFTTSQGMSAGDGMGDGGTEEDTGDDDDEGDDEGGDGGNADNTGNPGTGAPTTAGMTGGDDEGGADSTGWPWPDSDGGGESGGGGGTYAELCASWDMHAQQCGFGMGGGAACQYDLDYASYFGEECASAIEDYYACLASTDCAELSNADPATVCGADQVVTLCGGG